MPTSCKIEFENNPMKVIYTGQLLRGTVRLDLTEEKIVRGIYIRIKGEAYAHWTEGSDDDRKSYTGHEDYLDEKTYFVGGSSGEFRMAPGAYLYTFECLLPASLPTSVEGAHGHIRYTAQVVLDIPMWLDKSFGDPFTVIKAINLNDDPVLREPAVAEKDSTFFLCCLLCCFPSNPIKIIARTPVGGYTAGQTINLEINVNNQSDQPVSKFSVQLIKEITYNTWTNSISHKLETISITEQDTRGCNVNQKEIIRANIEVPSIPPTDFSTSNIVKVRYLVRIIGSVTGCHVNPTLDLPITIGSYPIQDNIVSQTATLYPHNTSTKLSIAPSYPVNDVISQQPSALPSLPNQISTISYPNASTSQLSIPNEAPPTYEEAIQRNDPNGNHFKPKYPMFKHATSYSSGR